MKDAYYFGALVKQVDVFAFPRTGSHFLAYCFNGLFDLVSMLPVEHRLFPEAISRQNELREEVLCAPDLREPGVPFQPVWLNPLAGGVPHSKPEKREASILLLIREPISTVYSAWRARKRLGFQLDDTESVERHFERYVEFYEAGLSLIDNATEGCMLLRYEDLVASPAALERIVRFVGVKPKLRPDFVYAQTRFPNFARPGDRSFYREGRNDAWRDDPEWMSLLSQIREFNFGPFGYPNAALPIAHAK